MLHFLALLLAAQTVTPAPVKTIVVDNRAPCFGGRIGEARQMKARMAAEDLGRSLKKAGYKVRVVVLGSGFERTMPDDGFRTFTAIC